METHVSSAHAIGHDIGLVACLAAIVVMAAAQARAADLGHPKPIEPDVAEASDEAMQTMAGVRLPDGWTIELYAAEPIVANVVAFDIDNQGRMYVCETFRQNRGVTDNRAHDEQWLLADLAAETVQDRIDYHKRLLGEAAITYAQHDDRIRRLADDDGDGKADRSDVLASGFNRLEEGTGAGVLARGRDVYYTCIPKLWRLIDQDDDGQADERVVLSDGYGVRVAFRGHDMHGLVLGPDGRLYFSIGDRGYYVTSDDGRVLANPATGAVFRCELDGTALEVYASGLRNPQELAFNDVGDLFTVDNNSDSGDKARIVHLLEGGDSGWRMHYQYAADRGPFNRERIWEPFHREQPAYIVPPVANLTDGPSGLAYYPGTGFGDQLRETFLICDFRGGPGNSGIRSFKLDPLGASYRLSDDSDPIWNALATDVAFGPDGALYVSDWVDGWDGLGKGRIYRITDPRHLNSPIVKQVASLLRDDWASRATDELIDDLCHIDRRVRFESQWQLAARDDDNALLAIATDASESRLTRLHAIWGADQIARRNASKRVFILEALRPSLDDADEFIVAAVAKVMGERGDRGSIEKLRMLVANPSPRIQYFATLSLAKLQDAESFQAVVAMLAAADNSDPALRHAGQMFLASLGNGHEDLVAGLAAHPNESVRRSAVVSLRRRESRSVAKFLKDQSTLVVQEAARAIHDQPIPVSLDDLASLIEAELSDNHVVHRVLNANYRLGTPEASAGIAAYAARVTAPEKMRIEALEMLASWTKPAPLDRVLNEYRPLPERPGQAAADALDRQLDILMSVDGPVREKTIEVASTLGLSKIMPLLIKRIGDPELRPALRASALHAVSLLNSEVAVQLARRVKLVPATAMVEAALEVLAAHDATESLPIFIEATDSRNMSVRQLGWDILATGNDPRSIAHIATGVREYLDGTLAEDVHLNVIETAKGKLDESLADALAEHGRKLAATDALGPWLVCLAGGDVEKGRTLFFGRTELSCVRCHKVDRVGGEVGPNLTTIGKQRDRRYLLESICLPDSQIAKGFETAVIIDDFGQVFTGIVKAENDEFIELINNDGSQQRIDVEQVVARKKGKSSMPADLVKYMTPRELRDLIAYLASLQIDPRAESETE